MPGSGSADWVCAARAGRDAITPTVRGTYDAHERYNHLDIVVMDGALSLHAEAIPEFVRAITVGGK